MPYLGKMTRPEVEKYLETDDVIPFPVGSAEQHGKYLPFDNDAFSAFEIAKRVSEETGVIYTSVMPFGYSKHHMNFLGSITLETQTLVKVYKEVCLSLIQNGFKKKKKNVIMKSRKEQALGVLRIQYLISFVS